MLFFVVFLPPNAPDHYPFEAIGHTLFWRIPAFILILLLLEKKPAISPKIDLLTLAAALPVLALTGYLVSLCAKQYGYIPPEALSPPSGAKGWISAILLSFSVGFLEEAYFRVYLPHALIKTGHSEVIAFIVSGLIFALCHVYEGIWGIANAILAAAVLSFAYMKSSSFPGIALAHGVYNVFVFISLACSKTL